MPTSKLYSYKMSHDNGFAPNPYFNVLTLATCKSRLRKCIEAGNWIAGWTSAGMKPKSSANKVGEERLVFVAKVAEKLSQAEYWARFPEKRPVVAKNATKEQRCGDNIYKPSDTDPAALVQVPNCFHHTAKKMEEDLKGEYVLVCNEFYYFGHANALIVPQDIRPKLPKGQIATGVITEEFSGLLEFVKKNASTMNILMHRQTECHTFPYTGCKLD